MGCFLEGKYRAKEFLSAVPFCGQRKIYRAKLLMGGICGDCCDRDFQYGSIYSFKGDEAEVGKIQIGDPEAAGRGLGKISLVLAMWIGFKKMGLKKIVGAVHQGNIAAHKTDMKIGFQIVGNHPAEVGGLEDDIEIDEARLCEMNSYTSEIKLDVM